MEKMKSLRYLKLGRRIENQKQNNWEIIDVDKFKITKPVIMVIGGMGTVDGSKANGYCKLVESLIGEFKNDVDIISIYYPQSISIVDMKKELSYFVDKTISPLFLSENGEKIDAKSVYKNFRKITLFTHCYGTQIAKYFEEAIFKKMMFSLFPSKVIEGALEQVFVVSYAGLFDCSDFKFKWFDITSPEDNILFYNGYEAWKEILNSKHEVKVSLNDQIMIKKYLKNNGKDSEIYPIFKDKSRCYVLKQNNGINLATTQLHLYQDSDHSIIEMKRTANWSAHKLASKAGDYVSRCLSSILCSSIATALLTEKENKLVPLNLKEMKKDLENITDPLNNEKKQKFEIVSRQK